MKKYSILLLSTFLLVSSSVTLVGSQSQQKRGRGIQVWKHQAQRSQASSSNMEQFPPLQPMPKIALIAQAIATLEQQQVKQPSLDPQAAASTPVQQTASAAVAKPTLLSESLRQLTPEKLEMAIAQEPAPAAQEKKVKKLVPFAQEQSGFFGVSLSAAFSRPLPNKVLVSTLQALAENEQFVWTGADAIKAQRVGAEAVQAVVSNSDKNIALADARELIRTAEKGGIGFTKSNRQALRSFLKQQAAALRESTTHEYDADAKALQALIEKEQTALKEKYDARLKEIAALNSDVDATYKLAGHLNIDGTETAKEKAEKRALRKSEAISDNEEEHLQPTPRALISVSMHSLSRGLLFQNRALNRKKQHEFEGAQGPKQKKNADVAAASSAAAQ